jgi:hypothetical protein
MTRSKGSTAFIALSQITQNIQAFVAKLRADPLEPANYKAVINSDLRDKWKKAMDKEFNALIKNNT